MLEKVTNSNGAYRVTADDLRLSKPFPRNTTIQRDGVITTEAQMFRACMKSMSKEEQEALLRDTRPHTITVHRDFIEIDGRLIEDKLTAWIDIKPKEED